MTTRKVAPGCRPSREHPARIESGLKPALLFAGALLLGGCATPGPLHVYSASGPAPEAIIDVGGEKTIEVPSFLEPSDTLTGLAYDPFTDHLFLRLAPGNTIRVVDRPARAIKREFTIEGVSTGGGGDLAVRSRDGHIFLLDAHGSTVAESTRLGKLLRHFTLTPQSGRIRGLALDAHRNRLLALHDDGRRITLHDLEGQRIGELTLERRAGASLAVDGEQGEIFAPLAEGERAIGVFDFGGRLRRTVPAAATFVDVGPRSLIRVF